MPNRNGEGDMGSMVKIDGLIEMALDGLHDDKTINVQCTLLIQQELRNIADAILELNKTLNKRGV